MKVLLLAVAAFSAAYVTSRFFLAEVRPPSAGPGGVTTALPRPRDDSTGAARSDHRRLTATVAALAAARARDERIPDAGELSMLQQKMLSDDESPEQRRAAGAVFRNLKIAIQQQLFPCWTTYQEPAIRIQVGVHVTAANGALILRDSRVQGIVNGPLTPAVRPCVEMRLAGLTRLEGPTGALAELGSFRTGVVVEVESPCRTCISPPDGAP